MATPNRPKRVVVVDADNPLVEITGDFFWREDHEALIATAREEAYRAGFDAGSSAGYQAGWADVVQRIQAEQIQQSQLIRLKRRPSMSQRIKLVILALVLLAALLPALGAIAAHLAR